MRSRLRKTSIPVSARSRRASAKPPSGTARPFAENENDVRVFSRHSQNPERAAAMRYLRLRPFVFQKTQRICGQKRTRGFEPPKQEYGQAAVGYLELGMLLEANSELRSA